MPTPERTQNPAPSNQIKQPLWRRIIVVTEKPVKPKPLRRLTPDRWPARRQVARIDTRHDINRSGMLDNWQPQRQLNREREIPQRTAVENQR